MEASRQPPGAQAAAGLAAERQPTPAPAEQLATSGAGRCSPPDALEHSGELAPVQEESEGDDGDGVEEADGEDLDAAAAEADGGADVAEAEAAAAGGAPAGGAAPGAKPLSVKNSCRVGAACTLPLLLHTVSTTMWTEVLVIRP